jgi:ligand-binding sensor domain-containing protein
LAVAIDDAGTVWLGGQMGVWNYDGKSEQQYLTDTFSSFSIGFIATGDSQVWAGSCNRSSVHDGDRWRALPVAPEQLSRCDTAIDRSGRFWIAGEEGIARLDEDQWVVARRDASFMPWRDLYPACNSEVCEEPRWSLAAGADVWAGMIGVENGLWRLEGDAWRRMSSGLPDGAGPISAITTASDGSLWVAAKNGVYHLDHSGWVSYPSAADGPPEDVQAIAIGADKVWVRGYQEAAVLDGETWIRYSLPDGLWDPQILFVDPEGAVWLPSRSRVARFNRTSFSVLEIPDPNPGFIHAMAIDPAGAWWMSTGDRLYRWVP